MKQTTVHRGELSARHLSLAYDKTPVCENVSIDLPRNTFTVIIGPNGCGKSTLLKALARTLRPVSGDVLLDSAAITSYPAKEVARRVALLPQNPVIPDAIRVHDLVARGRYPYHSLLRQSSPHDSAAIESAIGLTGIDALLDRPVSELSGGQRQRVWVAMVLAQRTPTLLLDEPTTSLDIAYQYEMLELFAKLQRGGKTVVTVLHDLNQAARFADHLVVMRSGRIIAEGSPHDTLTEDLVKDVFDLTAEIAPDPQTGTPMVIPAAADG